MSYGKRIGQLFPRSKAGLEYGEPMDTILALGPSHYLTGAEYAGAVDLVEYAASRRQHTFTDVTPGGRAGPNANWRMSKAAEFPGVIIPRIETSYAPFVAGSQRTLMAWMYRDNTGTNDSMFGSDGSPYVEARFISGVSNDFLFSMRNDDATAISRKTFANLAPIGAWVHLAVIIDKVNDYVEMVKNGVSFGSQTGMTATLGSGNLRWGVVSTTIGPLDGGMCHMACFERRLTVAEIASVASLA